MNITQVNLNRSWAALDLLKQRMAEDELDIVVVSEPPRNVSAGPAWSASGDGLAAIMWNPSGLFVRYCVGVACGAFFVVARCGGIYIASVYLSPSLQLRTFASALRELDGLCNQFPASLLICGDFNAHSALWSSPLTDRRGEMIERWAASHHLRLANRGSAYTCVRPQGSSVVDLTWVSSALMTRVIDWAVRDDL